MNVTKIMASAALIFSSAFASALPMFEGDTSSQTGYQRSNMTSAGYYLWNDAANTSNWHLRWTGIGASDRRVDWGGSLTFRLSNLDSASEFRFENRDELRVYDNSGTYGEDEFKWTSVTNNRGGIDGIDFTLEAGAEILDFALGSSLFQGLSSGGSSYITIGDGAMTTDMYTTSMNGLTFQHFGIDVNPASMSAAAVPEPGSLLLLGIGLVGLGLSRRRCA